MSPLSTAPRPLRGALVAYHLPDTTPHVVVFQYNPATVTRTLEAQLADADARPGTTPRYKGAPVETIKLDVEIDAADQLEPAPGDAGILPQLAALEILLYPRAERVLLADALLRLGTLELLPAAAPLVMLVWGRQRILPVRITEFGVTEDAHHPDLTPVRAKVSLGLRVVSYSDVTADNPAWRLFLAHQQLKESLAALVTTNALGGATGVDVRIP